MRGKKTVKMGKQKSQINLKTLHMTLGIQNMADKLEMILKEHGHIRYVLESNSIGDDNDDIKYTKKNLLSFLHHKGGRM